MKFVQEYCSICKKDQAMPVVQEDKNHAGLIWIKCPECNEIKPVEVGPESLKNFEDQPETTGKEKESGPKRTVRHYRSGESFNLGEWIYHPGWDDTGQIKEKLCSTGGREIIIVDFNKSGKRKLISNFAC